MRLEHRSRLLAVGTGLLGFACGGSGGGGTGPCTPGAATQLVKNGGDAQSWYFDNPLPTALSVKALDALPKGSFDLKLPRDVVEVQ